MDEIYPIIIPTAYTIIKSLVGKFTESDEIPPYIYLLFHPGLFNPQLKCYLIELMFMDGIDALVLSFAAYITLASSELIDVYTKFADDSAGFEEILMEVTKKLYSFNDVKGIGKLYNEYRSLIMNKYSDKIKLQCNPLIFPVDCKQPPPKYDSQNL